MKIKTILIDDERKALAILKDKIKRLCPNLDIVAETQNPKEGVRLIKEMNPQLVFLDIAMPVLNGFEVLKKINNPDFEIIFSTAFDSYAIEAIKHCAIGYLVKPVDNTDLQLAVNNAINNIQKKTALQKNKLLIENLDVQVSQHKKIVIPSQDGLDFVKISDIIYCEGVDGYTKIHFINKTNTLSSYSIGHFKNILETKDFYLAHKSFLINLNYVEKYLNEGYVLLSENYKVPVSRSKRQDFLHVLKK